MVSSRGLGLFKNKHTKKDKKMIVISKDKINKYEIILTKNKDTDNTKMLGKLIEGLKQIKNVKKITIKETKQC